MKIRKAILSVILISAAVFSLGFKVSDRNFEISRNLEIFHSVFRQLDMLYVDTVNVERVIHKSIDAMLSSIDPYTVYYPEDDQEDLKLMTTGKYAGIGSVVRLYPDKHYVAIEEPYEDQPAARSGLKAGDLILSIDGESMKDRPVQYVSERLRGEPDSRLDIIVRRPGVEDSIEVQVVRSVISLPSVPYYGLHGDVGFIMLDGFTEDCSKDFRHALLDLKSQGAQSLVIDLRGNGGGLLNEAVEITGMFVPRGTMVVETKGKMRQSSSSYSTRRDPVDTTIPLAVLVDGNSASASEILSGALQDLDRAVIVGDRTFGKGLVQTTRSLAYGGTLKVTTSKYYIPSGRCIQAVDYSHRDESGTATRIPDSLTHVFRTAGGRPVRDGGGIRPDIESPSDTMPDIMYYLSQDVVLFDFVNSYCMEHGEIAPAGEFAVSEELYESFKKFVMESDFSVTSQSSKMLGSLKELASDEGLYANASEEFSVLEKKLQYDMERDLDHFEDDLKLLLETEIVARYYFKKGAIKQGLRYDKTFKRACGLLSDRNEYNGILNGKQ